MNFKPSRTVIFASSVVFTLLFSAFVTLPNADAAFVSKGSITIGEGDGAPNHFAVDESANRLYVSDPQGTEESISIIDTTTNTEIGQIALPERPFGLAIDTTNNLLFATLPMTFGGGQLEDLAIIDLDDNNSITLVELPGAGGNVSDVNESNNKVFIPDWNSNTVYVVDTADNNSVSTISVNAAVGVAVNESLDRVYVSQELGVEDDDLVVINAATNAIVTTIDIPGEAGPHVIVVNETTGNVYVFDSNNDEVHVFNGNTNTFTTTIDVSADDVYPAGIGVNETTNQIFVSTDDNTAGWKINVIVIDGTNNTITETATADDSGNPSAGNVAVIESTSTVYVGDSQSGGKIFFASETATDDPPKKSTSKKTKQSTPSSMNSAT